jgi:carotenoid cleavage dioxygenase-like enzyme
LYPHRTLERILIMALSDVKVRSAKPEAKAYKLTDGDGMVLLVHPNGSKYWRLPRYVETCKFLANSVAKQPVRFL